jgi:hypothetical protein
MMMARLLLWKCCRCLSRFVDAEASLAVPSSNLKTRDHIQQYPLIRGKSSHGELGDLHFQLTVSHWY